MGNKFFTCSFFCSEPVVCAHVHFMAHWNSLTDVSHWLVNLMANEFEELSESGFIVVSGLAACQFEVDFGEVHTDCLWNESLEKFHSEVELDTLSFTCTSALERCTINSIDIERDPVFALSLMVEVVMNSLVHVF